jgi:hypothetical protein
MKSAERGNTAVAIHDVTMPLLRTIPDVFQEIRVVRDRSRAYDVDRKGCCLRFVWLLLPLINTNDVYSLKECDEEGDAIRIGGWFRDRAEWTPSDSAVQVRGRDSRLD